MDILETALQGAGRRRIVQEARLSYRQFNNIINWLLAKGLVTMTENPDGEIIFKVTGKGNKYIEIYRSLTDQQSFTV